jgi:hypothetical protein
MIWVLTMSMPVTISVTGCSTCDPGVHLDEVKLAVLVEKFESARAPVADFFARRDAALANPSRSACG